MRVGHAKTTRSINLATRSSSTFDIGLLESNAGRSQSRQRLRLRCTSLLLRPQAEQTAADI
jgi:hypothetical protein